MWYAVSFVSKLYFGLCHLAGIYLDLFFHPVQDVIHYYPFLHHPITHTHLDRYMHSNVCVITWLMVLSSCSHCVWSWRECSYPSYTGRRKHTCIYIHTVHSHTHSSTLRFCFLGGEAAGQEQWAACLASQSSSSLFLFSPFSCLSPSHVLQVMTRTKWTNYTLWFQTKQQGLQTRRGPPESLRV